MPMNDGDSISINLGKKGYTYLGVLMVFMLLAATGIGGYFIINNDPSVGTVRGAEKVWSQSDPVERQLFSEPDELEQVDTIIEEFQETVNSGWKKTESGKVFWENSVGYVEIDPHTCTSFKCKHNWKLENKGSSSHTLGVAFMFDERPVNPKFYRLESIEKTRPTYETLEHSEWIEPREANQTHPATEGYWNNYTYKEQNGTETYTAEDYVDRSGAFSETNIDGKWVYYTTDYTIAASSSQEGFFTYESKLEKTDTGFGAVGKWDMYIWKGNYNNPTWELKLDPWLDNSYANRFSITVLASQVDEDITNYTTFFNLSDSPAGFWNDVQGDGGDILVTQGEETIVERELVNFDTVAQTGELHFIGNVSSASNTTFYIYYNNPSADNQNSRGAWDSNYKAVYHLKDETTSTVNDSTVFENTGTKNAANQPEEVDTGQIYQGQDFDGDGSDDKINIGSDSSIENIWDGGGTIMLWLNTSQPTGSGNEDRIIGNGAVGSPWTYVLRDGNGTHAKQGMEYTFSGGTGVFRMTSFEIPFNQQAHIAWVYNADSDANTPTAYVDGQSSAVSVLTPPSGSRSSDSGLEKTIGRRRDSDTDTLTAVIDEFRIHTSPLSADHISTIYNNQFSPSTFYNVGVVESSVGWTVNLDAPTDGFINNTVDGNTTFFATPLNLGNSTAFLINATLYSNVSGSWEARASNSSEISNNTQFSITDIEYTDGTFIWNMEVCGDDAGVECEFNATNFTYIVDSTPPTIQIQEPSGEFNQNSSIPLNVTAQPDGSPLDQFWYNIDGGSNITFTPNTTFTIAAQGNHTLTAFVNDSAGNEVFNTTNFSWIDTSNYTVRGEDFNRILGGATILLLNSTYNITTTTATNSIYIDEDKFDSINTTTWPGPNSGATAANTCGFVIGPSALVLSGPDATLTSDGFNVSQGGYIEFYVKRGTGLGSCGLPNGSVFFQYSTNGGSSWTNITEFADDNTTFTDNFGFFQTEIPAGAETANTTFRFVTASSIAAGETWAVDVVTIRENGGLAQFRWDELPQGSVTQNISLDGYVTNESSKTINEFTVFNDTVDLDYAGLDISVFDEQTTAELTFNITVSTESNSKELLNLTGANINIKQLLLMEGEVTISISSDGYATRDITATLSTTTKPVIEAFLIEEAASVDATINVQQTLTEDPVEGATIEVKKVIGGTLTTVATLETDSTGSVTIALDPTVTYTLVMTFEDETQTATFKPTGVSPSFTFSISGDATTAPPTTFSNFFWRMLPRTSFVIMQNDTGAINLTTGSPAEDLEFFKLTLTYNGTEIFSETNTTAAGGDIDGVFNMTDALNLSTRWSVEQNIRENGETNVVTATFEYKRNSTIGGDDVSSVEQTITKNYRLTDNVRGLFNILTSIEASEMSKGLMWMILVMIVVIGLSMVTGFNTLVAGIGVLTMVAGVIVGWLPFWPTVGIAIIAMLGLVMMRGRN